MKHLHDSFQYYAFRPGFFAWSAAHRHALSRPAARNRCNSALIWIVAWSFPPSRARNTTYEALPVSYLTPTPPAGRPLQASEVSGVARQTFNMKLPPE